MFLCAGIRAPFLRCRQERFDAGKDLYVDSIVAGEQDRFIVDIDHVIAEHFPVTDGSGSLDHVADVFDKISS